MTKQYIDQEWHNRLVQISPISSVNSVMRVPHLLAFEKEFVLNHTRPNLAYRSKRYDIAELDKRHEMLEQLSIDISNQEPNKQLSNAYNLRITELQAANRLLHASVQADWHAYAKYNLELYGTYDLSLFNDVEDFLSNIVDTEKPVTELSLFNHMPTKSNFAEIKKRFIEQQLALQDTRNLPQMVPLKMIEQLASEVLAQHAPSYTVSVINAPIVYFRVSHSRKLLIISGPSNASIHRNRYNGLLLGHEIGMHIMRRYNASQGSIGLFVTGAAGSSINEEGLGVIAEQAHKYSTATIMRSKRFIGIACRYYAVGLALQGESFTQIYHYFNKLFLSLMTDSSPQTAHHYAWHLTESVFRGTSKDTDNAVFMRPAIYLKQMIDNWKLLANESDLVELIPRGKFDTRSADQKELIRTIE